MTSYPFIKIVSVFTTRSIHDTHTNNIQQQVPQVVRNLAFSFVVTSLKIPILIRMKVIVLLFYATPH